MSNNYLDPLSLEAHDVVRWVHPGTGKVYRFEVVRTDYKSANQPVSLELLSDIKSGEELRVTRYTYFTYTGCTCWPYTSVEDLEDDEVKFLLNDYYITLDKLLPDSDAVLDATDASDATDVEIPAKVAEEPVAPIADLKVPSITELQEIIYTSKSDFGVMVTKALAKAIKQGKTYAELPPVLIEMHKEELEELGYEVRFSAIYWDFLD